MKKASHLGNALSVRINLSPVATDTNADLLQKRAIFYDKVHQMIQKFGYCDPRLVCELVRIYGTSFYGSTLWNLTSKEHEQLNRSWNTAIKIIFDLPFGCHTRFVESLTDLPHLQSVLHSRYAGFVKNLKTSNKIHIKMLLGICENNLLTNTGQNISFLMQKYNCESRVELENMKYKIKNSRVYDLPDNEKWKINIIEELSLMKLGLVEETLNEDEIKFLMEDLCTS